jgi:hypothetical protein
MAQTTDHVRDTVMRLPYAATVLRALGAIER